MVIDTTGMKRLALAAAIALAGTRCASSGSGGAGGGIAFEDCFTDYCVGYGSGGRIQALHLRTPGSPRLSSRGDVRRADGRTSGPRTVERFPATAGAAMSVSRVNPVPASPGPAPTSVAARRP